MNIKKKYLKAFNLSVLFCNHLTQGLIRMKHSKIAFMITVFLLLFASFQSCKVSQISEVEKKEDKNKEFLTADKNAKDLFHVLLSSDGYMISQMNLQEIIERLPDTGGDQYMCEEIKKFDIIDEQKEAVIKVWLYPDLPGRIMKIRPQTPSYLLEVDELLTDDVQRWNFKFPRSYVSPTQFTIKYRIILRKKKSDKEILKDIKELMRKDK